MNRRGFARGLSAAIGAALASIPRTVNAAGARSGDWCVVPKGDAAFDFSLPLLDGEPSKDRLTLGSYAGSALWVTFYATWCPPCNREAADIVALGAKYRAAGLQVVGVDVQESAEAARAFVRAHRIDYPVVLDARGIVFKGLQSRGLPTHVFLDRSGQVTCIAGDELARNQMDNEIAVALERDKVQARPRPSG